MTENEALKIYCKTLENRVESLAAEKDVLLVQVAQLRMKLESALEASAGQSEIPTCPGCNGDGAIMSAGQRRVCPDCHGLGFVRDLPKSSK